MKVLIWDFDGTLARRRGAWSGALLEVLALQGITGDRERLRPWIQSGFPWHTPETTHPVASADAWWERLEPVFAQAFERGADVETGLALRLAADVRRMYVAPEEWELFDDTREVLTTLSERGWTHYILSNHVPELSAIVEGLGIARLVRKIFNSAETGIEKPHPAAFRNLIAELPPDRTLWMIGDSMTADIQGAEAHDIPAILVRSKHPEARRQCDDLRQLLAILG